MGRIEQVRAGDFSHLREAIGRMERIRAGDFSHLWPAVEFAAKSKGKSKKAQGTKDNPKCNSGNYQCKGSKGVACIPASRGCKTDLDNVNPVRKEYVRKAISALTEAGKAPPVARIGRKLGAASVELTPDQYQKALELNISQLKLIRGDATRDQLRAIGVDVDGLTAKPKPKSEPKPKPESEEKAAPATTSNRPPSRPVGIAPNLPDSEIDRVNLKAREVLADYEANSSEWTKRKGMDAMETILRLAGSDNPEDRAMAAGAKAIGLFEFARHYPSAKTLKQLRDSGITASPEAITMATAYTFNAYQDVNRKLRSAPPAYRQSPEEKALSWAYEKALAELPGHDPSKPLYRGTVMTDRWENANDGEITVQDYNPGEVVEDPAVLSTSRSRNVADGFLSGAYGDSVGVVFSIKPKADTRGADLEPITMKSGESETAFPPNTEFRIISKTRDDWGGYQIELEEM